MYDHMKVRQVRKGHIELPKVILLQITGGKKVYPILGNVYAVCRIVHFLQYLP